MYDFISYAVEQARVAYRLGEVPVGAVVVYSGNVLASAYNMVRIANDPTAHAEILVLRAAGRLLHSAYLDACDLYVTLEPCPMCAQAISIARIRRVYFGAYDYKSGGVESGPRIYTHQSAHHKPEVYGGIREREINEMLKLFFHNLRQH